MHRALYILALIVAGEAVFALPFHLARFFRPTVLDVFALTPTELGAAQGAYGIVAMLAYFPGGALADRFQPRKLLALSLWCTAAGGLYMATFPGYLGAFVLWALFGVTTILLFWAALIRATRDWGGHTEQGLAYGLLEGGRGALAAALASLGVLLFSISFPDGYQNASTVEKHHALRTIIYGYTTVTALAGALAWFVIRDAQPPDEPAPSTPPSGKLRPGMHMLDVLRIPAVWLQAIIVVCAYVGYKGFDNYALFAVEAYGIDEVEAAKIVTIGSWLRPLAAIGAGLLGDRFRASRMLLVLFALLLAADLCFALYTPRAGSLWVLMGNIAVTCIAIFGFRALYFALLEEAEIPLALTGTAVGFISVLGFSPDIFVTLVAGILIERSPGTEGHQHFFLFLAAFALAGLLASATLMRVTGRRRGR